jgi:hypothetical protein
MLISDAVMQQLSVNQMSEASVQEEGPSLQARRWTKLLNLSGFVQEKGSNLVDEAVQPDALGLCTRRARTRRWGSTGPREEIA